VGGGAPMCQQDIEQGQRTIPLTIAQD
jgi:hypothetical protein